MPLTRCPAKGRRRSKSAVVGAAVDRAEAKKARAGRSVAGPADHVGPYDAVDLFRLRHPYRFRDAKYLLTGQN